MKNAKTHTHTHTHTHTALEEGMERKSSITLPLFCLAGPISFAFTIYLLTANLWLCYKLCVWSRALMYSPRRTLSNRLVPERITLKMCFFQWKICCLNIWAWGMFLEHSQTLGILPQTILLVPEVFWLSPLPELRQSCKDCQAGTKARSPPPFCSCHSLSLING